LSASKCLVDYTVTADLTVLYLVFDIISSVAKLDKVQRYCANFLEEHIHQ